MRLVVLALLVALGSLLLVALIRRPRILLLPVIAGFAAWTWIKTILSLPGQVGAFLEAATLEKNATGLAYHAQCATALAGAGMPAASREVFNRVCQGYGFIPEDEQEFPRAVEPLPFDGEAYDASRTAAAAAAVQATGGKPIGADKAAKA